MILIALDSRQGTLSRYEAGGSGPRLTHQYRHGKAASFTQDVVNEMRYAPHEHHRTDGSVPFHEAGPPVDLAAYAASKAAPMSSTAVLASVPCDTEPK